MIRQGLRGNFEWLGANVTKPEWRAGVFISMHSVLIPPLDVLIPPLDRFDELATKVLDVLRPLSARGATEFPAPDRGAWIFEFDGYRSDGRATAVRNLLKDFGENIRQATVHRLDILAGYVVLNAERYDCSKAAESNSESEIKVRQLGAMLRHEFGG